MVFATRRGTESLVATGGIVADIVESSRATSSQADNDPHVPDYFGARVLADVLDPTMWAILLVAGIFCLFLRFHLIALEPYWLYIAVLIGAAVLRVVFSALWEEPRRRWHQSAFIGANMAIIAVVAYSTGWGPILSIGFLFGAATAYELFGSNAILPCLVWTAVVMIVAQLSITLHFLPDVDPPTHCAWSRRAWSR